MYCAVREAGAGPETILRPVFVGLIVPSMRRAKPSQVAWMTIMSRLLLAPAVQGFLNLPLQRHLGLVPRVAKAASVLYSAFDPFNPFFGIMGQGQTNGFFDMSLQPGTPVFIKDVGVPGIVLRNEGGGWYIVQCTNPKDGKPVLIMFMHLYLIGRKLDWY